MLKSLPRLGLPKLIAEFAHAQLHSARARENNGPHKQEGLGSEARHKQPSLIPRPPTHKMVGSGDKTINSLAFPVYMVHYGVHAITGHLNRDPMLGLRIRGRLIFAEAIKCNPALLVVYRIIGRLFVSMSVIESLR